MKLIYVFLVIKLFLEIAVKTLALAFILFVISRLIGVIL